MKLVLNDLVNLESQTSAVQIINTNSEILETAFENTLSRDGTTPNTMGANLDMNSHRMLNLPAPASNSEPLRLIDIGGLLPADIATAGASATAAASSAASAAASATAAAGYVGAASTAPQWTTGRTIILTGDVTGTSPAWNGTANLAFSGTTISTGAITAAKMATGASITNIGYTPINKAGDSVTGDIRLSFTALSLNVDSVGFRGIPVGIHDANYTLTIDDVGRMCRHTSATAHAWTINPISSTAYPIGAAVSLRNVGTGAVTITRGAGVTLRKSGSAADANVVLSQWGLATMVHEATDTWVVTGIGIV